MRPKSIKTAIGAGLIAASALIAPAHAQAPDWTGAYFGGMLGVRWSDNSRVNVVGTPGACSPVFPGCTSGPPYNVLSAIAATSSSTVDRPNGGAGGQIGYNLQFGTIVVGVEADILGFLKGNRSETSSSVLVSPSFPGFPVTSRTTVSQRLDYLGTVRGRVGYLLTPSFLVFATGGFAYGGPTMAVSVTQPSVQPPLTSDAFATRRFSKTETGYTVGGGIEYQVDSAWSVKAEYAYYDLGRVRGEVGTLSAVGLAGSASPGTVFTSSRVSASSKTDGHAVKVGLNYKLNWF